MTSISHLHKVIARPSVDAPNKLGRPNYHHHIFCLSLHEAIHLIHHLRKIVVLLIAAPNRWRYSNHHHYICDTRPITMKSKIAITVIMLSRLLHHVVVSVRLTCSLVRRQQTTQAWLFVINSPSMHPSMQPCTDSKATNCTGNAQFWTPLSLLRMPSQPSSPPPPLFSVHPPRQGNYIQQQNNT